jgi:hypothetical protein
MADGFMKSPYACVATRIEIRWLIQAGQFMDSLGRMHLDVGRERKEGSRYRDIKII